VTPDADIKMTVIGAVFWSGRNCWTTLYLVNNHSRKYYDKVKEAIVSAQNNYA
jgi:aldehyde dehydrogenase (NAD+)